MLCFDVLLKDKTHFRFGSVWLWR